MSIDIPPQYRTLVPRIVASLLDQALIVPILVVNNILYNADVSSAFRVVSFIFAAFFPIIYSVVMHAKWGQTLGKMATGVQVISIQGRSLTWRQAIRRESLFILCQVIALFYVLPQVIDFSPIGEFSIPFENTLREYSIFSFFEVWQFLYGITAFFDQRSRGIHDRLGQSVVVRLGTTSSRIERAKRFGIALLVIVAALIFGNINQSLLKTPTVKNISAFSIQFVSPKNSQAVKLNESIPVEWYLSPAPHGQFHVDIYLATDPEFTQQLDVHGASEEVHNLWGLMRGDASYQWSVDSNTDKVSTLPEKLYLRIKVSSSIAENSDEMESISSETIVLQVQP